MFTLLFALNAHAGFRAKNGTTELKNFDGIQCSTGLACSRAKGDLLISTTGSVGTVTAATATTITAAQCGSTFYNTAAVVIKLPKAVIGCNLTFVTMNASNFDVNPDDADRILGLTDATGDAIRNATIGNSVHLRAVSATQWVPVASAYGTWTDIN